MDSLTSKQLFSKLKWKSHKMLTQVPLIFKWQQEVLKFNICVNCSSPKTDLETNSLNMENQSFENVSFS